tara:strand:- start:81 stop:362 length:282 start_codon:yes stop_codon:yes gene_type:complete
MLDPGQKKGGYLRGASKASGKAGYLRGIDLELKMRNRKRAEYAHGVVQKWAKGKKTKPKPPRYSKLPYPTNPPYSTNPNWKPLTPRGNRGRSK